MHSQVSGAMRVRIGFRLDELPASRLEKAYAGRNTALEATHGQMDSFSSQLLFECNFPEVASVGDRLKICPWVASRVGL